MNAGAARLLGAWLLAATANGGTMAGEPFELEGPAKDADGVLTYTLRSPCEEGPCPLRVLLPADFKAGAEHRLLFVLPVEAKSGKRFGDGFAEVKKLNVHTRLGLIVVAPSWSFWPWYADHPAKPERRQEGFFLTAVLPAVDKLYPTKKPCRLLLGFSKSGWGAFTLLLRHPELFAAAAAWDAPLMKEKPDQFEMPGVFATQANFEPYQVTKLLRERAAALGREKRLALLGYGNFRDHVQKAHALMQELKIPHDYSDGPRREHLWGSGWLPEAIEALDAMTREKAGR
jgi:hypothetical protein